MTTPPPLSNTLAKVSLLFGVLGLLVLPFVGQIVAIITGHLARAQIRRRGVALRHEGLAQGGLLLGWIGLALLTLIAVVFYVWFLPWLAELAEVLKRAILLDPRPVT